MITAGPHDDEVMTFGDWVAMVKYAETHTQLTPAVLRTLGLQPRSVDLEDLADELDDLWETNPSEPVKKIIVGVLERLVELGVELARREDPS